MTTQLIKQEVPVTGRKGKVAEISIDTETYNGREVETKVSVSPFQILESDISDFLDDQRELIKRYCA